MLVDLGGLIAGILFSSSIAILNKNGWIISIYPAILSMRGVISGIFSGKLSTSLHLGIIYPSFRKNSEEFYHLIASIATLIFIGTIYISFISILYNFLVGRIFNPIFLFNIIFTNMFLSFIIISPITITVAFLSYKSGLLDPDYILYPVMSTIADIIVTLIYVTSIKIPYTYTYIPIFIEFIFGVIILLTYIRYREEDMYRKMLRETILTLLIVSIIVGITGQVLSKILTIIGYMVEIVLIYPALIDTVGDAGSIIGSIATTRLALGTIGGRFRDIKNMVTEITASLLALIIMSLTYSIISQIYIGLSISKLFKIIMVVMAGIVSAGIVMISISYFIAIVTFRFRLDPDNFVNPIESSIADTITTSFLALSIILYSYLI